MKVQYLKNTALGNRSAKKIGGSASG